MTAILDAMQFQYFGSELRLYSGDGSLEALPRELRRAAVERAVVVCGPTVAATTAMVALREVLGSRLAGVCTAVKSGSPVSSVLEVACALKDLRANAVIAVGGGSAAVTSRAASIVLAEGQSPATLCTRRLPSGQFESPKLVASKLPQFVIPTTPSTAFVKAGSAVHDDDTHERFALFDPKTRARAVFMQPSFLATAPARLVMESALNTLGTAIEALESPRCDPVSEAFLRQALRMLSVQLKAIACGDPTARDVLAVAAVLCGRGTDQAGGGLASVLGHAIGHRMHVSNGIVNAIVLTHVMRFNSEVQTSRAKRIADSLRELCDFGLEPVDALDALFHQMGVPRSLRDIGVERADLPVIADVAMNDWFIGRNARPVENVSQVMCILEAAW